MKNYRFRIIFCIFAHELIIYDYFLKVINDECFTSYMDTTKNDKCSTNYSELTNKDMTYKFLKKNGTLYKHTFKKDGKSYYWISSKPVNQEGNSFLFIYN